MAKDHYENFPVASAIMPKEIRMPIAAIYAFARIADDISDEGTLDDSDRLDKLEELRNFLVEIEKGNDIEHPYFTALAHTIKAHKLPINLFHDLLDAFTQDVTKKDYETFDEVLSYCNKSANPVGRLLLHLTHCDSEENLKYSDYLCTSFQLINFMQDIESDLLERNRCYLPKDLMVKFNLSKENIRSRTNLVGYKKATNEFIKKSTSIFLRGYPLASKLKGIFGLEIKAMVISVDKVIKMLEIRELPYKRPTLKWNHWASIIFKTIFFSFLTKPKSDNHDESQSVLSR